MKESMNTLKQATTQDCDLAFCVKRLVMWLTNKLKGRRIVWTPYFRMFTDGGYPVFRYLPVFHCMGYAGFWGMRGFWVNWIGRQFFFSFGKDRNGLYT